MRSHPNKLGINRKFKVKVSKYKKKRNQKRGRKVLVLNSRESRLLRLPKRNRYSLMKAVRSSEARPKGTNNHRIKMAHHEDTNS